MTGEEAIKLLAEEAERLGADANDSNGIVRELVVAHGLEFYAWFCVCCELADRAAQRQGYKDQFERALQQPGFQKALAASHAEQVREWPNEASNAELMGMTESGCLDSPDVFSVQRLPHLPEFSEWQHGLVTLLNAATSVNDQSAKQFLFEKFCEQIGVQCEGGRLSVPWTGSAEQALRPITEGKVDIAVFGYKCQECGKGTVRKRVFPQYQTKVNGHPVMVENAQIGVCDGCGAEHFDPTETLRWRKEHTHGTDDHGLAAWENEGGQ